MSAPIKLGVDAFSGTSGPVIAALAVGNSWVAACPPGVNTGGGCGISIENGNNSALRSRSRA